jgi:hypothetical protein
VTLSWSGYVYMRVCCGIYKALSMLYKATFVSVCVCE